MKVLLKSGAMTGQTENALSVIYDGLYVHCHASRQARLAPERKMDA